MSASSESARTGRQGTGISVVINTLNEERNIADCIESVRCVAEEVVVCDMYSDDKTVEIARQMGARVVLHDRTGYVEPARRYAIGSAKHEWVLVLDADERMTPRLGERLIEAAQGDGVDVVAFWSLYEYFGGWVRYGGFFHGYWRRFFRKEVYLKRWERSEEQVHHNFAALAGARVLSLPSEYHIIHYAYPTIEKYVSKTVGWYARLEAEQYLQAGRRFTVLRLVGEPCFEFVWRFVAKQGFRDGIRGLVIAVLYSMYRFSVWANVWFLAGRPEKATEREQ